MRMDRLITQGVSPQTNRVPAPHPVFATKSEMSDMELFSRDNSIRLNLPR